MPAPPTGGRSAVSCNRVGCHRILLSLVHRALRGQLPLQSLPRCHRRSGTDVESVGLARHYSRSWFPGSSVG
jgi:hypothetical protein